MASAKDKKAAVLKALKKAGATGHQFLVLDAEAAEKSVADSEEAVEVEIDAEASKAWLNGVPMDLNGGKGSEDVLPGNHVLSFEVRGAPGTAWSVQITAPPEARDKDGDTFDRNGFDAGRIKFVVKP
jgi:hypothetical protein